MKKIKTGLKKIKTGPIERRLSLAKAGLVAGARHAGRSAGHWLLPSEQRRVAQQASLSQEMQYFVHEVGKLKGSVVKVGQMMAMWGSTFLPPEVIRVLHELNDHTQPLEWPIIERQLMSELGVSQYKKLVVDPTPIGCASLGQVHRATAEDLSEPLCLKVQYPDIADSIDADLASMTYLLKMTRLIPMSQAFESWLEVIRRMLHQEVDYRYERQMMERFHAYLRAEHHYIVPKTFAYYSTQKILAMSYHSGEPLNSMSVLNLSQPRRNALAKNCLELFWQEVFVWGEMQTDPNFGNYLVQSVGTTDCLVLLDFGAVYHLDQNLKSLGLQLISGGFLQQPEQVKQALIGLGFLNSRVSSDVFEAFYQLVRLALEPFLPAEQVGQEPLVRHLGEQGEYLWGQSDLPNRLLKHISSAAFSRHFKVPPKELVFISRKILGAYSLMGLLGAELKGCTILQPYLAVGCH